MRRQSKNGVHNSMAMRTACPPLNQPLSDHPETKTEEESVRLIACALAVGAYPLLARLPDE